MVRRSCSLSGFTLRSTSPRLASRPLRHVVSSVKAAILSSSGAGSGLKRRPRSTLFRPSPKSGWPHGENEWSPTYVHAVRSALVANIYPQVGGYPVRSITVPIMREALLLMERRGALAALRKVRMWTSQVFRYAIATGRADIDPAAPLRGTFKTHKGRNFAAITKPEQFGELIAKIKVYDGSPVTRCALMLMAYTFVRTGELRGAEWSEFDLEGAVWRVPAERMKMGADHIV